jgi:hypothetical protein
VKAIYILLWIKAVDDGFLLDVLRQRQLDQHAIDTGIGTEGGHCRLKLRL